MTVEEWLALEPGTLVWYDDSFGDLEVLIVLSDAIPICKGYSAYFFWSTIKNLELVEYDLNNGSDVDWLNRAWSTEGPP